MRVSQGSSPVIPSFSSFSLMGRNLATNISLAARTAAQLPSDVVLSLVIPVFAMLIVSAWTIRIFDMSTPLPCLNKHIFSRFVHQCHKIANLIILQPRDCVQMHCSAMIVESAWRDVLWKLHKTRSNKKSEQQTMVMRADLWPQLAQGKCNHLSHFCVESLPYFNSTNFCHDWAIRINAHFCYIAIWRNHVYTWHHCKALLDPNVLSIESLNLLFSLFPFCWCLEPGP